MQEPCPCCSGAVEAACCGPVLDGVPAETALALMRSRYTAYVRGAIDYLVATHVAASRGGLDVAAISAWSRETNWLGLEIVATERGAADDDTGSVEFIARGVTRGAPFAQRERLSFAREAGAWVYVDGVAIAEPARRIETTGRNDPCPCGSGMKYKRCHGR